MEETIKKDLAYYRALPYTRRVEYKEDEGEWASYFLSNIDELPGCFATGKTRSEAIYNLSLLFDDYIEGLLELRGEIPEPVHPIAAKPEVSDQLMAEQPSIRYDEVETTIDPQPEEPASTWEQVKDQFSGAQEEVYADALA